MRLLLHDYSGHPFQAQLSRALAVRGHDVLHSTCTAYVSGKGDLDVHGTSGPRFSTVGSGPVKKHNFVQRTFQEMGYGLQLIRSCAARSPTW